ncbi:hypothetical protein PSU4_52070 [Pseudonocardia sulfidoxydans NBRC 16205]|uniref:Mucin n=1 Tax=Pseudonocardia sulfidoxydans NBRC 16205 TaxID=1223511 RepID=A0A511DPU3_9PSEU|nr:DUF6319 family protein [Pseudonocardia sulfidoxydans]GEL26253.1 hypothetical protein PSU4_52070 [Pseudonocardia sulfidoxydans NBRC 16205]
MTTPDDPRPETPTATPDSATPGSAEAGADTGADSGAEAAAPRRRGRPKGATSTARRTRLIELTLTVSGSADGEWQADLKRGTDWIARALPVTATAVVRAAAELHADLAAPIEEVVSAARTEREARVAALEAELEQARKALAEFA